MSKRVDKDKIIYVAGHNGLVGRATVSLLRKKGYNNIITQSSNELDLRVQDDVQQYIAKFKPDLIIDAAAKVGGIYANKTFPYSFLMDNMQIQNNLIDAALKNEIKSFIFLGSSCIYPKLSPQPIKEEYLLTSQLEPTNKWYALAKISGVMSCDAIRQEYGYNYISLMPTNLYGEYDNFDLKTSHVIPAMIRKFHEAKINNSDVILWGSGTPSREFMHVKDLANAILFVIENEVKESLYNVGTSKDLPIKDLAQIIQKAVGHTGNVIWDSSMPDGTPRKLLNTDKIKSLGWSPRIELEEGIKSTYSWFKNNVKVK
jgi:GDP-L-fucose synthase